MTDVIRFVAWLLTHLFIPLRYTIQRAGWNQIRGLKGPVLLLPNHPAFIDPAIILAEFYRDFRPRTVLYEGNFPGLIRTFLIKLLRAVSVPELERPNRESHIKAEQAIAEVIEGLRRGDNFVLWPSGRIQRDGVEHLGAARTLTDILQAVPEVSIVLVRTRGLWGSMFSFAQTGRLPRLGQCLLNGSLLLAANLLVFMPRRRVEINVELIDRRNLPELKRELINRWFEKEYNPDGPEQPSYVPYHFLFGPIRYEFPPPHDLTDGEIDSHPIRPETSKAIAEILSEQLGRSLTPDELKFEMRLDDLGMDSLQRMDLAFAIERKFNVHTDVTPETVGQLLAMAEGVDEGQPVKPPPAWFRVPSRIEPLKVLGETIPEAFVTRALSNPNHVAVADDFAGVLTYERLLVGALLLSRRFSRLSDVNVGLMLPASVASDMALQGLYLANKRPVLLNWTTGTANVRHAVSLTNTKDIITSRQLRARLGAAAEIAGVQFIDIEDLTQQLSWIQKIYWLLVVRFLPGTVHQLIPKLPLDTHAVILFTSGSEKAPKAVPLTHANVVSNIKAIPNILDLTNQDAMLGFLPMFHSFGLTATGLFPLLAGVRLIHHADPADAAGLRKKVANYLPGVLVGTPTIVGRLLDRGRSEELSSLKLIVVGAETCPATLFEKASAVVPNAIVLEGYGVTECSPIIAGNRPTARRSGTVGQPLPGVEVCVVDMESDRELPEGTMGMLLVHGPGVFPGYLGNESSPFVVRNGKRWYVTGDLAAIDPDGYIHFRGRLKRFVKAGGEMISLPALEEPFSLRYPPSETGPRVAVEGIESEGGRKIVLFTTESLTLDEANGCLAESGLRGVMRIDEVHRLDAIPLLGTGKTDYKTLREMIRIETPV